MASDSKIRVGIVGASASRGCASIAHVPGLRALPQFEIAAVCTIRRETAEAAARHYGGARILRPQNIGAASERRSGRRQRQSARSLSARDAAIEAGKHVYCVWSLGRDTAEATRMLDAAERWGIRHVVGLQGQMSPAINYAKERSADGYVGRV